jgi:hypothetical protein
MLALRTSDSINRDMYVTEQAGGFHVTGDHFRTQLYQHFARKKKTARSISCHIPYDCFLFSTSSNGSDDGFLVLLEVLGELSAMEV